MARRPTARPQDKAEDFMMERESKRLERLDDGPSRAEMERGSSAPGRSPRPVTRPAKKFAEGGMVRGCSGSQMSGKGFSGNF